MQIGGRPPPKRPVYRSEFVIRLQTMRENRGKRGKAFDFELLDEPIDWRPSSLLATPSIPIRTTFGSVRTSTNPKFPSKANRTTSKVLYERVEFPLTSGSSSPPAKVRNAFIQCVTYCMSPSNPVLLHQITAPRRSLRQIWAGIKVAAHFEKWQGGVWQPLKTSSIPA